MDKHISLSPCPFCGMDLTLDIDEEGGVAILHSLKGEKNCWFPSIVDIEMPVETTLDEMVEILNRRPIQESFEHAIVKTSLVAAARLQDKHFEIQDLNAELAQLTAERDILQDKFETLELDYRDVCQKRLEAADSFSKQIIDLTNDRDEWRADAERLAENYWGVEGLATYCIHCNSSASFYANIPHDANCPITLHRQLVAKYGGENNQGNVFNGGEK